MLVSNTHLIKDFVIGIMLFCFMSDMLCWFANEEHQHLKIEFNTMKTERPCLKLSTILYEALNAIVWCLQLLHSLTNRHNIT